MAWFLKWLKPANAKYNPNNTRPTMNMLYMGISIHPLFSISNHASIEAISQISLPFPGAQEVERRKIRETLLIFSWGSLVGLGLFFVSIGAFLVLLHYAGLIG